MAIFKCIDCDYLTELGNEHIGLSIKCPRCKELVTVQNTISYIDEILKENAIYKNSQNKYKEKVLNTKLQDIDIHNTDYFAQNDSLDRINKWFNKSKIKIDIDANVNDTRGFFDEIAVRIGDNFEVLNCVTGQLKYAQHNNHSSAKINVSKKSKKDLDLIRQFCQELYDYSFVSKYTYSSTEKIIWLALQTSPRIKSFFDGLWMEWYIFMKLLYLFKANNISPACSRQVNISFDNNTKNELDVFILTQNNIPIVVECKSGEFRQNINKYQMVRKRLGICKENFILCVFGLSEEQTTGMSNMYDITIVNESLVFEHIEKVISNPLEL